MTDETSERRFVERRSAHADNDEVEVPLTESPPGVDAEVLAEAAVEEEPSGAPSAVDLDLEEMARVEIPEPSFYEIIQPLEIQALQFLGELPLTSDGQRGVLPRWAKHVIDLLGVLDERTRGNLT